MELTLARMLDNVYKAPAGLAKREAARPYMAHDHFRWFWVQALSPFVHYNLTLGSGDITFKGTDEDPSDYLVETLDKVQAGELTGSKAKRAVKEALAAHSAQLQRHIINMVNKTPRIGLAIEGLRDLDPNLIPRFMVPLAKPVVWSKVLYPCLVSPKIDGLRCVYEDGELFTRKGHVFQGLKWMKDALKIIQQKEPNLQRLDGELISEGCTFDEISGKLRSFHETKDAFYNVFDMVLKNGESVPLVDRLHLLSQMFDALDNSGQVEGWAPVGHLECKDSDLVLSVYDQFVGQGYEGAMVKDSKSVYYDGRKADWQKLKPTSSLDMAVISYTIGQPGSAIEGQVAAIECQWGEVMVLVGSGLTSAQRTAWARDPNLIVGRTVEVKFMEHSSKGSLRHPRLMGLRPDK